MTERHDDTDYSDADEQLMSDDIDLLDDEIAEDEIEEEETSSSTRGFNMEIRQRIEDRLEQRRLEKELGGYDSYDIDDY